MLSEPPLQHTPHIYVMVKLENVYKVVTSNHGFFIDTLSQHLIRFNVGYMDPEDLAAFLLGALGEAKSYVTNERAAKVWILGIVKRIDVVRQDCIC